MRINLSIDAITISYSLLCMGPVCLRIGAHNGVIATTLLLIELPFNGSQHISNIPSHEQITCKDFGDSRSHIHP